MGFFLQNLEKSHQFQLGQGRNFRPLRTQKKIPASIGIKLCYIFDILQGFWAAVSPFNFTAIGGNLCSAPALMVCTTSINFWGANSRALFLIFSILQKLPNVTIYHILTPLKYHVFENILENGAFSRIFSIVLKIYLDFFQCCLKIENDVMI